MDSLNFSPSQQSALIPWLGVKGRVPVFCLAQVYHWKKTIPRQGSPAAFFISLAASSFGAPGVRPLGLDSLF